jgi:hypothetical protein
MISSAAILQQERALIPCTSLDSDSEFVLVSPKKLSYQASISDGLVTGPDKASSNLPEITRKEQLLLLVKALEN